MSNYKAYKITVKAVIGVAGNDKEEAKQNLDKYIKKALGRDFVYDITDCEEVE